MGKSIIALKNVNRLIENRKMEIVFQIRFKKLFILSSLTFRSEYTDPLNWR